jgi:hypothetical protein
VDYSTTLLRSESESRGGSRSSGRSEANGWSDSDAHGRTTRRDGLMVEELSQTDTRTRGSSRTTTQSTSEATSLNRTEGWSEALLPVLKELPTSVFSLEEQIHKAAAEIRNLRSRRAIIKIPGRTSAEVSVPFVQEGYARDERVQTFEVKTFQKSPFVSPVREGRGGTLPKAHRAGSASGGIQRRGGGEEGARELPGVGKPFVST